MSNTNNTNTNKNTNNKKGENKMSTNVWAKSISENKEQAMENLEKAMKEAVNVMNHIAHEKRGTASKKVSDAMAHVKAYTNDVNTFKAMEYYNANTLTDVVKAGRAVPQVSVKVEETDGVFSIVKEDVTVYPTLTAMVKANLIDKDVVDTVDVLRRMIAYTETGDETALTGDVANKKDMPNKNVSAILDNISRDKITVTKARAVMRMALKELTNGAFNKDVFPKVYKDFAQGMIKKGSEWGIRTMVGKATANDYILEYLHMSLNGKTAFQFVIE